MSLLPLMPGRDYIAQKCNGKKEWIECGVASFSRYGIIGCQNRVYEKQQYDKCLSRVIRSCCGNPAGESVECPDYGFHALESCSDLK